MYETFCLLLAEQRLLPKLDTRISNVLIFIEQHIGESLNIADLAKVSYLSPTQFKKNFKKQLGVTVLQYISSVRMEKAQALLTHTDYPLRIIGEQVGYKELSTFSRKFKQHFGISPKKFKKLKSVSIDNDSVLIVKLVQKSNFVLFQPRSIA